MTKQDVIDNLYGLWEDDIYDERGYLRVTRDGIQFQYPGGSLYTITVKATEEPWPGTEKDNPYRAALSFNGEGDA